MHPPNAPPPIEVTLFGMVTDVRLVHTANALLPIEVTELGISTDVRLVHPWNARYSIEVTELPLRFFPKGEYLCCVRVPRSFFQNYRYILRE